MRCCSPPACSSTPPRASASHRTAGRPSARWPWLRHRVRARAGARCALEAAREREFPVFEVPDETPFIAITEAAFSKLVNEQYSVLRRALSAQERLERVVLSERGLEALAGTLATLVGASVLRLRRPWRTAGGARLPAPARPRSSLSCAMACANTSPGATMSSSCRGSRIRAGGSRSRSRPRPARAASLPRPRPGSSPSRMTPRCLTSTGLYCARR